MTEEVMEGYSPTKRGPHPKEIGRMNMSSMIDQLAGALAKAQGQLTKASKDGENPDFKSRYADLSAVWDACREALSSNDIALIQAPTDLGGKVGLRTTLCHKSGQWMESLYCIPPVKGDPQAIGSALTYMRRYALAAMVGVVADEDDDGNAASAGANKPKAAPPPPNRSGAAPQSEGQAKDNQTSTPAEQPDESADSQDNPEAAAIARTIWANIQATKNVGEVANILSQHGWKKDLNFAPTSDFGIVKKDAPHAYEALLSVIENKRNAA